MWESKSCESNSGEFVFAELFGIRLSAVSTFNVYVKMEHNHRHHNYLFGG